MKRIFFLFLFSVCSLFSSSPHLVDAECYQKDGVIKMRLWAGQKRNIICSQLGWQEKIIQFNQEQQAWQSGREAFSLEDLKSVLDKINKQDEDDTLIVQNVKGCLNQIAYIAQKLKHRDPVKFTNFYDSILDCFGIQTDLKSCFNLS